MWEAFCKSNPIYDPDADAAQAIMYEFEEWREEAQTRALVRRTANELGDLLFYDEFLYDPETAAEIGPKA